MELMMVVHWEILRELSSDKMMAVEKVASLECEKVEHLAK
jgi:hypothetical protein